MTPRLGLGPVAAVPSRSHHRRGLLRVGAAGLLLGALSWANAHEFHAAICDIQFNPRSGSTEIVQVYPMHDIEAAFWLKHGHTIDLTQAADEALLRADFDRGFAIEKAGRARLPIRWVGVTSDAGTLTVYQELPRTRLAPPDRLRNQMLVDLFPDYSLTVNLRADGKVRTLVFNRDQPVQPVP